MDVSGIFLIFVAKKVLDMAEKRGYGVGLQWFPDFIKRKAVYVDKTAYVYKMAQSNAKSFFLSRPRRFGKSLLVSTLQCYFEGRKELFKGLAIEQLEKEWIQYPVIRLDLSIVCRASDRHDSESAESSRNLKTV